MKIIAFFLLLGCQEDEEHARLKSATVTPGTVSQGDVVKVRLEIELDEGWHIYPLQAQPYTQPTTFTFEGPVAVAGDIKAPPTYHHKDDVVEYDAIASPAVFEIPLRIDAAVGAFTLKGRVRGQTCKDLCVDVDLPFSVSLQVQERKGPIPVTPPPPEEEPPKELWAWILLAIGGGLVSLIQPCVFPLLPITMTYFLKQSDGSSRRGLALGSLYGLGIVLTFTGIGAIFTVTLGADGPRLFAANPWVNLGVAALFVWFAFSLFGLYEIALPSFITGRLTGGGPKKGYSGAFILGLLFSIVTFTCTVPIAAAILTLTATAGERGIGFMAMLIYSVTMAVPFVLMGIFPSLIKAVQKGSGSWLHGVKVTMGFIELGLAVYYLSKADQVWLWGILTRPVMLAVYVSVLGLTVLYLLGVFRMKGDEETPATVGVGRMMVALAFTILMVYIASGFTGRTLAEIETILPPPPPPANGGGTAVEKGNSEFTTYAPALAEAKRTGKPIFLEFTGLT